MKTFEYRLRPNSDQARALVAILTASRELYNDGLAEMIAYYRETGRTLQVYEQDKLHGKVEHPDLPAVVVDATLKRLHRSFDNFFRGVRQGQRIGFPRFKSARRWDTIQLGDAQHSLKGRYFHAPK